MQGKEVARVRSCIEGVLIHTILVLPVQEC